MKPHSAKTFACDQPHLRLFALPAERGWKAAVFDLDASVWVYRSHEVFEDVKKAQQQAQVWADNILNRQLGNFEWIEWLDPVPELD